MTTPLHVAVVGSGPAGLYTAEALVKQAAALDPPRQVSVDVLDRLPTPYGLPQEFLAHAKRDEILEEVGLVPQHLARQITEAVARLTPELAEPTQA